MNQINVTRREFIITSAGAAGGLAIGVFLAPVANAAVVNPMPWQSPNDKEGLELSQWIVIDPSGIITVVQPHAEMGQGAMTSTAMMLNEELQADWKMIRVQYADANRHVLNNELWVTMASGGSNVVKARHPHIMQAGVSARERLKEAAAQTWGVPRTEVTAKDSILTAGNRRGTYAEFATRAAGIKLAEEPKRKTPEQFTFLGTSVPRLDVPLKVNGEAKYAHDIRLPRMVYAAVYANPVPWGGSPKFDFNAIKNRPGVLAAVELKAVAGKRGIADLQNGVAVVADTYYRAKTALDLMPIEWDYGPNAAMSNQTLFDTAYKKLGEKGAVRKDDPAALAAIAAAPADKKVGGDFHRPYEAHARAEPITTTVDIKADGTVDVYVGAQNPPAVMTAVVEQLGIDPKNCFVRRQFLGCGFGSSSGTFAAKQAAQVAKEVGRPVKLIWSREEDIRNSKHAPAYAARFEAAIGADGLPTAIFTRTFGANSSDNTITDMPYEIALRHHERHSDLETAHIPITTHRAPGTGLVGFASEQFIDDLARKGGWNPLEWRLAMTKSKRDYQIVLNALKAKAGYRMDLPRGEGMGVAVVESHGTIAGAVATVTVSRRGQLRVEKMVLALDSGHVINPLNATEQVEGSVVFGLAHLMGGGLEFQKGMVANSNFDTYRLLRIGDMPTVEVHFALSGGEKWGGLGEPGVPPTAPSVANAIFAATGKRVRSTPLTLHDLSWA